MPSAQRAPAASRPSHRWLVLAYFLDGVGDLLKEMFGDMDPKRLSEKALDRKLPVEVRVALVDLLASWAEDPVAQLKEVAEKGDGEVASHAARLLAELEAKGVSGKT